LFVGNLSYATTEADLRTYFGTVAPPSQVVLPVDRETGRPRGFAFVEYLDRAHAEQAIQRFNGQAFNGRPLAVSEARAREDRGPGGFSGPRPGGPSGPRPGGGFPPRPSFGGPRFDSGAAPSTDRSRNFGPDAKPQRGAAAKKGKKGDERPRGPIPVKATRRSFTLDDDDATAVDEPLADIDNFATSKPEDKDVDDKPDDDEKS
jgi:RNA recognition motif-containing protein